MKKLFEELDHAAIDPSVFPEALQRICQVVQASGAMLVQGESRTADAPRTSSMDEGVRFYFENGWHARDLLARGVPLLLQGKKSYVTQDVVTPDEMRREPFFHEVLYRHGVRWSAVVGVRAGDALWCLSLQRTARQGAFEAGDRRSLDRISDRLTQAATLSAIVGRVALTASLNALDQVRRPAVAVDRSGFVLAVNSAAEALFDDHFRVRMRRIVVSDARAQSELADAYACLLISEEDSLSFGPIIVPRRGRPPVFIRIVPISGPARTPFLGARALLILSSWSGRESPSAAVLARVFGLSPSEARTAASLAKGLSATEIAEATGRSRQTIKSHLKSIFEKTGVRRQTELMRLLMGAPEI